MGPRGGVCQCHQCLISLSHQVNHLLQCQILIICIFSFQNKFVRQKRSGKPCRTFHFTLLLFTSTFHIHLFYISKPILDSDNFSELFSFHFPLSHFTFSHFYHSKTNLFDRKGAKMDSENHAELFTFHFTLLLFTFTFLSRIFIISKQNCSTEKERRWTC